MGRTTIDKRGAGFVTGLPTCGKFCDVWIGDGDEPAFGHAHHIANPIPMAAIRLAAIAVRPKVTLCPPEARGA
jgi:hypothetical protein